MNTLQTAGEGIQYLSSIKKIIVEQAVEIEKLRTQYEDLIYCVHKKYPGESSHDTAKRYLIDREVFGIGQPKDAAIQKELT